MISACETEDGVVFDMSELEADALRSYADGLIADPKHPFVDCCAARASSSVTLPSHTLLCSLRRSRRRRRCSPPGSLPRLDVAAPPSLWVRTPPWCRGATRGGLYAGEDDLLSVWAIDSAQLRETFFRTQCLGGNPPAMGLCRRRYRRCSLKPSIGVMPRRFLWRYRRLLARLPT